MGLLSVGFVGLSDSFGVGKEFDRSFKVLRSFLNMQLSIH